MAALVQAEMAEAAGVVLGAVDGRVIWTFEASGYGIFGAAEIAPDIEAALGAEASDAARTRGAALTYDEAVAFVRARLSDLAQVATAGAP